jgi:type I restriction enzyme, S subunit
MSGGNADMPREWHWFRLGDVARVKHGFAFDGRYFTDEPSADVLVTPGNFAIGGGFKSDKPKYYRGPVPEEFVLPAGALVVTMTDLSKTSDTLGYAGLVPYDGRHRYLHNQRIGRVDVTRPELVDLGFLHWLLRGPNYRAEILAGATGTTVKHTAPGRIEAYEFHAPSLAQQQAIAHILGALDGKIELNRRTNEVLEAMARALFKSWFVDFDPVRAKAQGRKPAGLDPDTAKLFPKEFVDSALGEIPKGWQVITVGDWVELQRGTTYKSALLGDEGPCLLGLASIKRDGGFRADSLNPRDRLS